MITRNELAVLGRANRALGALRGCTDLGYDRIVECLIDLEAVIEAYTDMLLHADESEHVPLVGSPEKAASMLLESVGMTSAEASDMTREHKGPDVPAPAEVSSTEPHPSPPLEREGVGSASVETRRCRDCGEAKPIEGNFEVLGKFQKRDRCVDCHRAKNKAYKASRKQPGAPAGPETSPPPSPEKRARTNDHAWVDQQGQYWYIDHAEKPGRFTAWKRDGAAVVCLASLLEDKTYPDYAQALIALDKFAATQKRWARCSKAVAVTEVPM